MKNTQPNLDAIEASIEGLGLNTGGPGLLPSPLGDDDRKLATKSGLISLDLTVPTVGRILEFKGPQKPEPLTLSYQSWERQVAMASLGMIVGALAFWFVGRRRPCLSTGLAILLLSCVPLMMAPTWLVACNTWLAGWLAALVSTLLWRLAKWFEHKWPHASTIEEGRPIV